MFYFEGKRKIRKKRKGREKIKGIWRFFKQIEKIILRFRSNIFLIIIKLLTKAHW